jgi:hypothetical protein
MISSPRKLMVVGSSSELPDPREFPADTVVLDLPLRLRWAAFQQVRERYSGRLIVTVSSEWETAGWLPDPACWFLVRPFGTEEVMRALRAPVPATAPAPRPAEAAPESARVARLSSEESLWEVDSGAAAPSGAPAPTAAPVGLRRPSRRWLAEVVGALILVIVAGLGGIAIGRASVAPDRIDVSAIHPALRPSATSQASPPATGKEVLASAASCLSALDRSDAAISYLVGNIRDQRLSRSMQQYQADRRACRERVR